MVNNLNSNQMINFKKINLMKKIMKKNKECSKIKKSLFKSS